MESAADKFKKRDRAHRLMSVDGKFRAAFIKNTDTAQIAALRHNLNGAASVCLAKALGAASLLSMFLKGEERIIVEVLSDTALPRIYAEAIQVGEARGFVERTPDFKDNAHIDLYSGFLRVSRILYNKSEPLTGIVPLNVGDISSDLAYYLHQSEQIPSTVFIESETGNDGIISKSGGIIVQAMPGATFNDILEIEKEIVSTDDLLAKIIEGASDTENIKKVLPFDFSLLKSTPVDFYCRCSKDSFISKLITLGKKEISEMQQSGQNELVCRYCNERYYLDDNDYTNILTIINSKRN